jgi:hypothetical protein
MEDQDVRSLLEHEAVRVLFVDDDQSVIRAYGSALAHDGVTVETASINVGYYPPDNAFSDFSWFGRALQSDSRGGSRKRDYWLGIRRAQ